MECHTSILCTIQEIATKRSLPLRGAGYESPTALVFQEVCIGVPKPCQFVVCLQRRAGTNCASTEIFEALCTSLVQGERRISRMENWRMPCVNSKHDKRGFSMREIKHSPCVNSTREERCLSLWEIKRLPCIESIHCGRRVSMF